MLGGGHVRRQSMQSVVEASPCIRIEKRKHYDIQGTIRGIRVKDVEEYRETPSKARIIEKPSIASASPISDFSFGEESMIKARQGLLAREGLEEGCLIGEGEEVCRLVRIFRFLAVRFGYLLLFIVDTIPALSRPTRPTRSRSGTCTSSSGADTKLWSLTVGSSASPVAHTVATVSITSKSQEGHIIAFSGEAKDATHRPQCFVQRDICPGSF